MTPSIVWSIGGTDSGGGAGLAADLRAANAFGVHLCPVVAAVTAQNSRVVTRVDAVAPDLLEAQLRSLASDMPPRVVKTGLLGGAEQVRLVARWVRRLREAGPLALVVDPVLGASTGRVFCRTRTPCAPTATSCCRSAPSSHRTIMKRGHCSAKPAPTTATSCPRWAIGCEPWA